MLQLQTQQLKYFKITLYNEQFTDIFSNVKTGVINIFQSHPKATVREQ